MFILFLGSVLSVVSYLHCVVCVICQPPVLEEWEEVVERNGVGYFRGNVFGQRGLADGTAMTTAPVDVAGRRIQDQVHK